MAQVAAARSIHGSFFNQGSGSVLERVDKLKPASFASKVLARDEEKSKRVVVRRNSQISAKRAVRVEPEVIPVSPEDVLKREEQYEQLRGDTSVGMWSRPIVRRKTKIVCTIGPSTNTREMIWKLAETGMNVARLKMSHGDHASHQKVIDLVKDYNAQFKDNTIAIMLDTKGPEVRSGNLSQPITLTTGQEFTFTIQRGVGAPDCVSANYDNFVNDVEVGDMLLVDALPPPCNQEPACMCNVISNFSSSMMPLMVKSKTEDSVKCEVVDGGELKSRRHLNFQGKSARLLSITCWSLNFNCCHFCYSVDFPLTFSSSVSCSPFAWLRDCEEQQINYFNWFTAEKDWDA